MSGASLADRVLGGDPRAIARVISHIENETPEGAALVSRLYPSSGRAFLIGVILTLLAERTTADPRWRLLIVVGGLGGYTTFSSFAYEAFALAEQGHWLKVGTYVIGTNVLGIAACVAGVLLTRRIAGI